MHFHASGSCLRSNGKPRSLPYPLDRLGHASPPLCAAPSQKHSGWVNAEQHFEGVHCVLMALTLARWSGLLVLVLTSSTWVAGAQVPSRSVLEHPFVRQKAKAGLDLLYDMRFAEATVHFEEVDRRYGSHPIGPFLLALTTWWEILLDLSDTKHDDVFYASMAEVIRRSDEILKLDVHDFDAIFFKGLALGFRGRLRSNRREWILAAADGKRAMNYVLAVAQSDSINHDYVFGRGLYNYYAAVIPERYPFARAITPFLPKGNRELGLEEIKRVATKGHYVQTEAAYFLLQIYYVYESDYLRSREYVELLRRQHPGNPFFHTIDGRIHARWGDWSSAEAVFRSILERFKTGKPGYNAAVGEQALYYLALAHMSRGEYNEAAAFLLQLEALSARLEADTYFKVMGRLHQGMVYDALGRRKRAETRYRQVLAMKAWGSSHTQASRYLKTPYGKIP